MYDPARDVFASSEDGSGNQLDNETDERRSSEAGPTRSSPTNQPTTQSQGLTGEAITAERESESESAISHLQTNNQQDSMLWEARTTTNPPADFRETIPPTLNGKKRPRSSEHPDAHTDVQGGNAPRLTKAQESTSDTIKSRKRQKTAESTDVPAKLEASTPQNNTSKPLRTGEEANQNSPRSSKRPRSPSRFHKRRLSRSPQKEPAKRQRNNNAYLRRTPSPQPLRRTPTPPPRSPPRERKRPGGASRITAADKEALRQRQIEREQRELEEASRVAVARGNDETVRQHYNAVPERGRDWRKTDSRIKGLRSFNNWIKSTIIQKFSPNEDFTPRGVNTDDAGELSQGQQGLLVLDMGCGKGGDLGKWQQAPQPVALYVGVDGADVSIDQAKKRYEQMRSRGGRGGRGGFRGGRQQRSFQGEFFVKDAFGTWLGEIPIISEVGIDPAVGPHGGSFSARWGRGGFDVVSMMFCMHYAFESEEKARGMLRNVAGCLKKGGRFIGVIPNSDVLRSRIVEFYRKQKDIREADKPQISGKENGANEAEGAEEGEVEDLVVPEWGNSIYRVRFPGKAPEDGVFRPPFGWKYSYFMEEAVEEIPEYVVPWEAFRAIAEDYNLEQQYRKPFTDVWKDENNDPILGPLSETMGVREAGRGPLRVSDEEMEAASFYHAFCFYKV